jgi:cell division protein ZapE
METTLKTESDNYGLILAYNQLVTNKKISDDPAQRKVLTKLDVLKQEIEAANAVKKGLLKKVFNKKKAAPKGLYIWGGVGRGKSMLMDLFYANLNVESKRRTHFHAFMIDVHKRIKEWQDESKESKASRNDVIQVVADEIARESKVLCFDEMQVKDIADAMILGRLFSKLFEEGVTVIATSNRPPDDLYKDGLQRDRFLPFIEIFKQKMNVHDIESDTDYRLLTIKGMETTYFHPLGAEADKFIENALAELTRNEGAKKIILRVKGRRIDVEKAFADVAMFSFAELCEKPLGAEDYIEVAKRFSTVLLRDIPKLHAGNRNEALRFINLIDAFYEAKTNIICTADASVTELYDGADNSFEFQRTISRLIEMQSDSYIKTAHIS